MHRTSNGRQQRHAGDRHHEFARQGDEPGSKRARKCRNREVEDPGHRRRHPSPSRIGMGFGAHAQGSGNRCQIEGEDTEGRQQQRRQTDDGQQSRNWRALVAGGPKHCHTRQVLRGHGDEKQRNRDTEQHRQRELRRPRQRLQAGAGVTEPGDVGCRGSARKDPEDHQPDGKRDRHRQARRRSARNQIGRQHRADDLRGGAQRAEGLDTESQQHPGKQRAGKRQGNAAHEALEEAACAGDREQQAADDEGADRLRQRHALQADHQQCRARRRPGNHHWDLEPDTGQQAGQPHAERERRGHGGELRGAQTHRGARLHDDRIGTREPDQNRDQPGSQDAECGGGRRRRRRPRPHLRLRRFAGHARAWHGNGPSASARWSGAGSRPNRPGRPGCRRHRAPVGAAVPG